MESGMKYPHRSPGGIISGQTFSHSLCQKQSFNNALAKVRFGMNSGSLRKAGHRNVNHEFADSLMHGGK